LVEVIKAWKVRLQTSIRYKEHGELKTIGQRLREKQ